MIFYEFGNHIYKNTSSSAEKQAIQNLLIPRNRLKLSPWTLISNCQIISNLNEGKFNFQIAPKTIITIFPIFTVFLVFKVFSKVLNEFRQT